MHTKALKLSEKQRSRTTSFTVRNSDVIDEINEVLSKDTIETFKDLCEYCHLHLLDGFIKVVRNENLIIFEPPEGVIRTI